MKFDYKMLKKQLKAEKMVNKEEIANINEKIEIIDNWSLENKFTMALVIASIPFTLEMVFLIPLCTNIEFMRLFNNLTFIIPATVGIIGTVITNKQEKVKEKFLNLFGKKPSFKEKEKRKLEYEIMLAQKKQNNRIINNILEKLDNEKNVVDLFSNDYIILDKGKNNNEDVQNLEKELNNTQVSLNNLIKKRKINIDMEVANYIQIETFISSCFLPAMFILILSNLPNILIAFISHVRPYSWNLKDIFKATYLTIGGFLISLVYEYKKDRAHRKALDEINNELISDDLELNENSNKDDIAKLKETKEQYINLKLRLEKEKQKLNFEEKFEDNNYDQEIDLNENYHINESNIDLEEKGPILKKEMY